MYTDGSHYIWWNWYDGHGAGDYGHWVIDDVLGAEAPRKMEGYPSEKFAPPQFTEWQNNDGTIVSPYPQEGVYDGPSSFTIADWEVSPFTDFVGEYKMVSDQDEINSYPYFKNAATGLTAWWLPSGNLENGGKWIINDSPGTVNDDSLTSGEALTSEEDYFDTPDYAYWLIPEIEEEPEEVPYLLLRYYQNYFYIFMSSFSIFLRHS